MMKLNGFIRLLQPPAARRSRWLSTASKTQLDEVVSFCKRRGFIFSGSELYGSIGTGYDYGPLGSMLKKNVQDSWWKDFIERRPDCVPLESALLMNPRVWQASGHVHQFVDPLTECASCKKRTRADKLVKATVESMLAAGKRDKVPSHLHDPSTLGSLNLKDLSEAIAGLIIPCPACGASGEKGLGKPRTFNLLFKTHVGPVMPEDHSALAAQEAASGKGSAAESEGAGKGKASSGPENPNATSISYLRPETAQGVYVNFSNVMASLRKKLPLGIGQMGKSFRNEIAVGNFVFRTREFEQMELQYFCDPAESAKWFDYWVAFCEEWLLTHGLSRDNVRRKEYSGKELAHYALATTDLEYRYPFGWEELWGIANRGDYDLRAHSAASGQELMYRGDVGGGGKVRSRQEVLSLWGRELDVKILVISVELLTSTGTLHYHFSRLQPFFPHAVEPAVGVNRLLLALLCEGLVEEPVLGADGTPKGSRTVLKLHERLAPYKAAVLPVVKDAELLRFSEELYTGMLRHLPVDYDATQAIGKRYRRQDEVGTPLCVTVDTQSLTDGTVTVRCRDSMAQVRVHRDEILSRCEGNAFSRAQLDGAFKAAGGRGSVTKEE